MIGGGKNRSLMLLRRPFFKKFKAFHYLPEKYLDLYSGI